MTLAPAVRALRTRVSAVACDAGAVGVRAVQIARPTAGGWRLRDRMQAPRGAETATDDGSLPVERLARLIRQGDFHGRDVALMVGAPLASFHSLRLPERLLDQSPARVREALALEVTREARAEPGELEVRYWPMVRSMGPNVMAVSLRAAWARAWFERFAAAGLTLRRIEATPCALVRAACEAQPPSADEAWGVLDLGHNRSTLTIAIGDTPQYVRELQTSGSALTRDLSSGFEITGDEAEQLKRTHGLQPAESDAQSESNDAVGAAQISGAVFDLLRGPLEKLTREVGTCFTYVLNSLPDANASRLLLAGGGARLRGLAEWLELQLGIQVSVFGNSDCDSVGPEFAAAFGTALLDAELTR